MNALILVAVSLFCVSSAHAAEYKVSFELPNATVSCSNENLSRFTGREVALGADFSTLVAQAETADGSSIQTTVRDVIAVESGQKCEYLKAAPKTLKGTRELSISKMKSGDQCNAYILDEFTVEIGKGNPTLYGKTAYPVVGDDFSVWSKEICKLTERDFQAAIRKVVKGQTSSH